MESNSLNDGVGWSHSHHVFFLFFINALCGIYYSQCVTGNKSQGRSVAFPGTDTLQTSESSPLFFLLLSATKHLGRCLPTTSWSSDMNTWAYSCSREYYALFFSLLSWFTLILFPYGTSRAVFCLFVCFIGNTFPNQCPAKIEFYVLPNCLNYIYSYSGIWTHFLSFMVWLCSSPVRTRAFISRYM